MCGDPHPLLVHIFSVRCPPLNVILCHSSPVLDWESCKFQLARWSLAQLVFPSVALPAKLVLFIIMVILFKTTGFRLEIILVRELFYFAYISRCDATKNIIYLWIRPHVLITIADNLLTKNWFWLFIVKIFQENPWILSYKSEISCWWLKIYIG